MADDRAREITDLNTPEITALLAAAPVYRKTAVVSIRAAVPGEPVTTVLASGLTETAVICQGGEPVVTGPLGEQYIPMGGWAQVERRYHPLNGNRWQAKGLVRAVRNPAGHPVTIDAPWGTPQHGDTDCWFAVEYFPADPDQVSTLRYLIGAAEFRSYSLARDIQADRETAERAAAGEELTARFAAAGYPVTTDAGGNAVLAPADAFRLLDLAEHDAAAAEAVRDLACKRCGGAFGPGSRAWGIVWGGERYWLMVRYAATMPLGPYHSGCSGAELDARNRCGQLASPEPAPATLAERILPWLDPVRGRTTRQLAEHAGKPENEVRLRLDALESEGLVRHVRFRRYVKWFLVSDVPGTGRPAGTARTPVSYREQETAQ